MRRNTIPLFYTKSETVLQTIDSMDIEVEQVESVIEDVEKQTYTDTATWGLKYWEQMLGLGVAENEDIEDRAARVRLKLRGTGVFNKNMIMNLCKSFTSGDTCVIEDNPNSKFIIKFIDLKGVPSNLDYLRQAIEEVKPAHLAYSFEYLYTLCRDYINWKTTCTEMLEMTCTEIKTYTKGDK